tara:strand:- start:29527 stop:29769 length:243 start_codon:yes stop_codon:yes gene_type:complete
MLNIGKQAMILSFAWGGDDISNGLSFPTSANVSALALGTMRSVGRAVLLTRLAALVFVEHLRFKSVAAVVAAEADALRHE